jgi:plastocyanin
MKKVAVLLALALASVALVACGSSNNESSSTATTTGGGESTSGKGGAAKEESSAGGGAATVSFEADPEGALAYTTTEATAKAGKVTIDFNNPQALTHDVAIENSKGEEVGATELIAEGEDSTTVDLKPGTYHYFCTVPGHREAGMEGTLVVK